MKNFLFLTALTFTFCKYSSAQVISIFCYDQNDSISSGVNNLLLNGGFEKTTCAIFWDNFCPNASSYSCDIDNWTCSGGGSNTYARVIDNAYSTVVEGSKAAYPGNWFCQACSPIVDDVSCLHQLDCTVTGVPVGYPITTPEQGGSTGISLEQAVNGLISGDTYVLEFWAGGFDGSGWNFPNAGLFSVDVGFGDIMLSCKPTLPPDNTGTTYLIEFNATSSTHNIKLTNWGHICNTCTEVIWDNVRLYKLEELACLAPTELSVTNITPTSAQLNWSINGVPNSFRVVYRNENEPKVIKTLSGTTSSLSISNLTPNTSYLWGVQARCDSVSSSSLVHGKKFKTTSIREGETSDMPITSYLNLHPNPASGVFTIDLKTEEFITAPVIIQIMNVLGQVIYTHAVQIENGTLQKEIQLNDAADGMYSVRMMVNGKVYTKQLMISEE